MFNVVRPFNNSSNAHKSCGASARSQIWMWCVAILAAGFLSFPAKAQTFSTPGSWTYTVPAGVNKVQVQVSGGGGGGGGADSGRGGNGGSGARVTAIITVSPGQVLFGTIGQGGRSAFTSGATMFGYVPCTGNGAGGTGQAGGGQGAAANCPGMGYSGSGAGGGGSTSLAVNGVVFVQAGGGGGGAGGGFVAGQNGTTSLALTSTSSCGTSINGVNATVFNGDAGGGGGGGGGFTAGTGGSSMSDFFAAVAGGGGGSCHDSSPDISSVSIAATGGAGAAGRTGQSTSAGPAGSNGSVVITPGPLEVLKTSNVTADLISASNFKSLPGATIRYCIVVRNNWGGDATDVVLTDNLPAQTSIVANSFNKGTTCANATNVEPLASITGSTVTANIGALATSASYALAFQVTLN